MTCNGCRKALDKAGSWSFANDFVQNVILFCVNNSLSIYTDNCMNDFLELGEGPTAYIINDNVGTAETKFGINLTISNRKFFVCLHYSGNESYLYLNKIEICKFIAHGNIPEYELCLESVSKDFTKDEINDISLNGTIYIFSVDHIAIE